MPQKPPAAFLYPQNAPKSLAAGALPQTPLGKLTALPAQTHTGLRRPTSKGSGKEGRRGEEGREGEGKEGPLDPHNVGNKLTPLPFTNVLQRAPVIHLTQ